MIYACGQPILHPLYPAVSTQAEYTIKIGNRIIYKGVVFPKTITETTIYIDISPICSEYLYTSYENLNLNSNSVLSAVDGTYEVFTVSSEFNSSTDEPVDVTYNVMYNYNTDYQSQFPNAGLLNNPIAKWICPDQHIGISAWNIDSYILLSYSVNNGAVNTLSVNSTDYGLRWIDLTQLHLLPGDKLRILSGNYSYQYTVVNTCDETYVLHYVNKAGGLDSLLCDGKYVIKYTGNNIDGKFYNDRNSRLDFEQKRLDNQIDKKYELNTKLLTDAEGKKIDELIYSPKVWIEDVNKNLITSCLITDKNYTVKNHRNDNIVQYTINVTESQQYIRR